MQRLHRNGYFSHVSMVLKQKKTDEANIKNLLTKTSDNRQMPMTARRSFVNILKYAGSSSQFLMEDTDFPVRWSSSRNSLRSPVLATRSAVYKPRKMIWKEPVRGERHCCSGPKLAARLPQ